MILLKISGSILIVGSCILYSRMIRFNFSQYVANLKKIHQILTRIMQEITYTRAPLPELFQQLVTYSEEPYCKWFEYLSSELEEKNESSFYEIWEKSMNDYLNTLHLKENHLQMVLDFGKQISELHFKPETEQMSLILQQLICQIQEEETALKIRLKLCNYLGVMSGLFLVILLF